MNPYPPYGPPPQGPPPVPPRSTLSGPAFVVALIGFLIGIIPFAGFLGTLGLGLGIFDLTQKSRTGRPERRGLSVAAVVLGTFSTLGALLWVAGAVLLTTSSGRSSCPHVYSFDGDEYRIDGDMVSGSLYPGAQREDLDRLEHLRATDGQYHVRIQNDLDEIDYVDRVTLLVADHAPGAIVLPTQSGSLLEISEAALPTRAVDDRGTDVLAAIASDDGIVVTGAMPQAPVGDEDPRASWTLDFPRPKTSRAVLVLHARNTSFAEDSFARYMATMGQGVGPLMAWVVDDDCACNREMLDQEAASLGLPLVVTVMTAGGEARSITVNPVGPAVLRAQAFLIDLPEDAGDRVTVRLEATPLFWEIDKVALGPASGDEVTPLVVLPREVSLVSKDTQSGALELLAEADRRRLSLKTGDRVDAVFTEPPLVPGRTRTVLLALTGYYEMPIGGLPGINAATVIGHRTSLTSLPRFAAGLAASSAR